MNIKRWNMKELDRERAASLAEECALNPFLALLLVTRGINTFPLADEFLYTREGEDDPFVFADMEMAVARISQGIIDGEKIAIYGDYDVDGVTATALLYSYFKKRGANVTYYIPHREKEGYGLSSDGIDYLIEKEVTLIVTVDNGISANKEIEYANSKGLSVVVTDHHMPPDVLPEAFAVVNPHRKDCPSQFKDYAGVGVAFKLASALEGDMEPIIREYGDLLALGTLGDVMPLVNENRYLVGRGMEILNNPKRIGLKTLIDYFDMADKTISATSVLFSIIPSINSAGRMEHAEIALKLLLTEDKIEAVELTEQLTKCNNERKSLSAQIFEEVTKELEENRQWTYDRVIVVSGKDWYPGVVGIIASRVLERYGRPCIILSENGKEATGSGRSISGFNLHEAMTNCSHLLTAFGGHELAAGLTLDRDNIDIFRKAINDYAKENTFVMPVSEVDIAFRIRPTEIDVEKINLISSLEPMGEGNRQPIFGLFKMTLDNITPIGKGKHLRLSVSRDGARLTALKFNCAPDEFPFQCGQILNLLVTLEKNEFRGVVSPSIFIKDIREVSLDEEELINSLGLFDNVMRGEDVSKEGETLKREYVERLYLFLRNKKKWVGGIEQLQFFLKEPEISFLNIRLALEVLHEGELLKVRDVGNGFEITVLPPKGKVDLSLTKLAKHLGAEL